MGTPRGRRAKWAGGSMSCEAVANRTPRVLACAPLRLFVACVLAVWGAMGLVGCSPQVQETSVPQDAHDVASDAEEAGNKTEESQMETVLSEVSEPKALAAQALETRLDDMYDAVYVYRDFSDSENHFTQLMKIAGASMGEVHDLDMDCSTDAHTGSSCVRCEHQTASGSWGGWMFMNGYVPEGATDPVVNDDTAASRGFDLEGARELRFWARGQKGGEVVSFFCAGFGYDGETGERTQPNADSDRKRELKDVVLSDTWQEYAIDLEGMSLTDISCGFGYAIDDADYAGADAVFYLDDIRYEGDVESVRQGARMMLRSYDTQTLQLKNAAYTYDNALAAMAFLSEGRTEKAECLLDSFVYAVEHDRYKPGRIRNAYAAGDIVPAPGWGESAKLPGWYDVDAKKWYEDAYQVGSNVGNTSYAALALLHYVRDATPGSKAAGASDRSKTYLETAQKLMDWVLSDCSDKGDGFLAGYDGWPENGTVTTHTYKSTEHNIDAYAAFKELYAQTGDKRYDDAARSALAFVVSMYDAEKGLFYTGTTSDGKTPDTENVVLDAQVWSALALGDEYAPYEAALDTLDSMRTAEGGYRFHACDEDAYWCEGTAFTALMLVERDDSTAARQAFEALSSVQLESGLLPAATTDDLSTGIYLSDGSPWLYGRDPHVGPTAWFVLACNRYNPYVF